MYSGGNSNGSSYNNSLKQYEHFGGLHSAAPPEASTTAAVSGGRIGGHDAVDWAQLAQQWIQMRDNAAGINIEKQNMPEAPPPPIISTMTAYNQTAKEKNTYEEKGEADMDMDEENDSAVGKCAMVPMTSAATMVIQQQQWYTPVVSAEINTNAANAHWNMWPPRVNVPPPPVMTLTSGSNALNPTAHIPSLLNLNVKNPNDQQTTQLTHIEIASSSSNSSSTSGIDANKRKMLPAWIREGLEKMEREKQKQLERHTTNNIKPETDCTISGIKANAPVNLLKIVNASESESGNEDIDEVVEPSTPHRCSRRRSTIDSDNVTVISTVKDNINSKSLQEKQYKTGKSFEQRQADLMIAVRRTLTELLLETTNAEIASIAQEAIKAHRAKASSAQVIRKSALSSITGKLGLAAYADSSSAEDSDSSDNNDTRNGNKDEIDSEEEIKATIRVKRLAFAKTIAEIEANVSKAEQLEEQRLKRYKDLEQTLATEPTELLTLEKRVTQGNSNKATEDYSNRQVYERDFGETTDTKLQYNGKRVNRKERTTRFSDNKDGKKNTLSATATTSYMNQMHVPASGSSINTTTTGTGTTNSNKLLPVPNPATALLQMPESLAHYATSSSSCVAASSNNERDIIKDKKSSVNVKKKKHKNYSQGRHRRHRNAPRNNDRSTSSSNSSNCSKSSGSSNSDSTTSDGDESSVNSSKGSNRSRRHYQNEHCRRYRNKNSHYDRYAYKNHQHYEQRTWEQHSRSKHSRRPHYSSDSEDDKRHSRRDDRRNKNDSKRTHTRIHSRSRSRSRCSYSRKRHY